jgi:hypothetical protein
MNTWVLVAIVVIAAVILLATIGGIMYWMNMRGAAYTDEKLTALIKKSYVESVAGRDPSDLEIVKIIEIQAEDKDKKSIYDVRIKYLAGEFAGSTLNLRYYLLMVVPEGKESKDGTLTVDHATAAPDDTPLKDYEDAKTTSSTS